jgi:long-subunit acyl-CoA synthetase (AMP-forming)
MDGLPLTLPVVSDLTMRTLPEILRARAQNSSNGITFLGEDGRVEGTLSYQDLFRAALSMSAALLDRGFNTKPSFVIICSVNDMRNSILCFWACCIGMFDDSRAHNLTDLSHYEYVAAGIPICPLPKASPHGSSQTSLLSHLQSLFPQMVILADKQSSTIIQELPTNTPCVMLEDLALGPRVATGNLELPNVAQPSDIATLMLTSGSSGKPKAVALRHSHFISSCAGKNAHHSTSGGISFLNWISFDHVASLSEIHLHAMLVDAP